MELKHEESKTSNRFYLVDKDNEVGEMTYIYAEDHIIDLNHTEINKDYRGQGLGEKLIEGAVEYMRKNNLKAKASCPYAKKMLERTDSFEDVRV